MEGLEIVWYIVFIAAVVCYSVLDGFDLGVGALHLCTEEDRERRTLLSAIGPVWDGNEVWLVIVVGALWAGFPDAYALIMSSFYIPIMLLICGLIFRAVSIEFRSKLKQSSWRKFWDWAFSIASMIVILSLGLIMGNFIEGISISHSGDFSGNFIDHINPYSLLVALMTFTVLTLHGATYLQMKVTGALLEKVFQWSRIIYIFFFIAYVVVSMATWTHVPHMVEVFEHKPFLWIIGISNFCIIIALGNSIMKRYSGWTFIFSSLNIVLLILLYAIGSFPVLLRAKNNPEYSLSIFNASSSETTLAILVIIAAVGIPLVVWYTLHVYKVFKGKVDEDSLIY